MSQPVSPPDPDSTQLSVPVQPDAAQMPGVGETLELKDKDVTARIIARWLDELFCIPGTNFKIGLDPIIDFVPGIGDFLSSSVSLVVIIEAVRTHVSPSVVMRMMGNMVMNAIGGALPGVGPVFSAFFKSNKRNLELLNQWHAGHQHEIQTKSRSYMIFAVLLIFLALGTVLLIWAFYLWGLWALGGKVSGLLGGVLGSIMGHS
jgi:hypothetical protein